MPQQYVDGVCPLPCGSHKWPPFHRYSQRTAVQETYRVSACLRHPRPQRGYDIVVVVGAAAADGPHPHLLLLVLRSLLLLPPASTAASPTEDQPHYDPPSRTAPTARTSCFWLLPRGLQKRFSLIVSSWGKFDFHSSFSGLRSGGSEQHKSMTKIPNSGIVAENRPAASAAIRMFLKAPSTSPVDIRTAPG